MRMPAGLLPFLLVLLVVAPARAEDAPADGAGARGTAEPALARWRAGAGPRAMEDASGWHLLDAQRTPGQSNAVAFAAAQVEPAARARFTGSLRVLEGGDGGAIAFLDTRAHGRRGPAPFVKQWVEPNLEGTFAVGIDVHNPPDKEPFSPWGNYQDLPQREVSLHHDGRELVKRVAPKEFRGDFAELEIDLRFVAGGAEVTVVIAGAKIYDRHFLPHVMPYPMRLALGAGTRGDATTEFDVKDVSFRVEALTKRPRPPLHVELFNHVLTDNSKTFYQTTVDLPPASWAFARVILTLDIHDAGEAWDEWDRNGELSLFDDEGRKLGILPFITSYRTECHWKVDVTPFRPWLHGKRKFEIRAGTTFYKNRGYMMSASLDFHHGTPTLAPVAVRPLWHGTVKYTSDKNPFGGFFMPQEVAVPDDVVTARIRTTTTGHSQVGEFTPSRRTIVFRPDVAEARTYSFDNTLWKTDVYLNPNRPQFGTWKYARAGWAPGDVVHPWWIDLTEVLKPGATARVLYEPKRYTFGKDAPVPSEAECAKASHVIRSFLIFYRQPAPGAFVPAPTLRITGVTKGSNAAKAGMQRGDYLAEYNGARIDTIDDLRAALEAAAASEGKIPAVLYRGTKRIEIELDPGRMGINLGR